MDELFDQVRKGLDKYNQRQQEKDRNRCSSQFAHLRTTAVATISAAKATVATSARYSASQRQDGDADRPVLFDSQLRLPSMASVSVSSCGSAYDSIPKVRPTPSPMKFDPPRFTFGSSSTTSSNFASWSLKKTITTPVQECEVPASKITAGKTARGSSGQPQEEANPYARRHEYLTRSVTLPVDEGVTSHSADKAESGSQDTLSGLFSTSSANVTSDPSSSLPQDQANKCTSHAGKRKALAFDTENTSTLNYYSTWDCGMYYYHPSGKQWTKEEVDGLVAFADKWIPDVKKKRAGEKK